MASLLAKAIRYEYPETIPVSVAVLPAVWLKYGEAFRRSSYRPAAISDIKRYNSLVHSYLLRRSWTGRTEQALQEARRDQYGRSVPGHSDSW